MSERTYWTDEGGMLMGRAKALFSYSYRQVASSAE